MNFYIDFMWELCCIFSLAFWDFICISYTLLVDLKYKKKITDKSKNNSNKKKVYFHIFARKQTSKLNKHVSTYVYIHVCIFTNSKSFMTKKIFDLKGFRGNRILG